MFKFFIEISDVFNQRHFLLGIVRQDRHNYLLALNSTGEFFYFFGLEEFFHSHFGGLFE